MITLLTAVVEAKCIQCYALCSGDDLQWMVYRQLYSTCLCYTAKQNSSCALRRLLMGFHEKSNLVESIKGFWFRQTCHQQNKTSYFFSTAAEKEARRKGLHTRYRQHGNTNMCSANRVHTLNDTCTHIYMHDIRHGAY